MGAVTVGISLPREWVGEHGLKPGGSVFLRALDDGSILVRDHRTAHPPTPLTIVVPLRAPPEHLFRQLIATYLEGAQEIVVREPNGLTEETLAIIKTFVRRTIQPEIVSQETDRITLREVSRGAGLPTRSLLRRVFALVLDIHKTANRSLGGERPLEPDLWIDSPLATRDDDIDRYAWLIERIVRLQLNPGSSVETSPPRDPDVLSTLLAARCLERVADHAVGIAEHGARLAQANLPETTVRPLAALHIQILDLLPQAFGVIDEPNATRANEVIDASEAQHVACDTLFERFLTTRERQPLTPLVSTSIGAVLQSLDRTVAYAQNLAEIGLDRASGITQTRLWGAYSNVRRKGFSKRDQPLSRPKSTQPHPLPGSAAVRNAFEGPTPNIEG